MTKSLELRPNRALLNPDFNGYKLSLEKIPVLRQDFEVSVHRVLPNSEQYSLLHAKLFGLHNHLFTDYVEDNSVYFVDRLWNVQKCSLNRLTGRLEDLKKVWEIPKRNEDTPGNYNVSLHFASDNIAVLSDGTGILYILKTGNRSEGNFWESVFSEDVLDSDKRFIVQDAVLKKNETADSELHCLLVNIHRIEGSDKFSTFIYWITLTESSDSKWGQVSLRVLQATGGFHYCSLEPNCKYIYIASDNQFKFTIDSENPITEQQKQHNNKIYTWMQTDSDITIRFNVEETSNSSDFTYNINPTKLQIKFKDTILIDGNLSNRIDSELTTWSINNKLLEVLIVKSESGLMWQDLIPNDETGEQIIDPTVVTEVHARLAHLCNEKEVTPAECGPTFSSQQFEECDFEGESTAIFERICSETHSVTHRTNLGSHQVIMTVKLNSELPPALAVRYDVDACLWSPTLQPDNHWTLKHEGTLLAFGYVQASKQQRKFSACAPDLSYSVICESNRHAFIYRQNKSVSSGELRNRRSGALIGAVAEQQVVSLGDEDIVGLSAMNSVLYLLTEHYILALKVCPINEL